MKQIRSRSSSVISISSMSDCIYLLIELFLLTSLSVLEWFELEEYENQLVGLVISVDPLDFGLDEFVS